MQVKEHQLEFQGSSDGLLQNLTEHFRAEHQGETPVRFVIHHWEGTTFSCEATFLEDCPSGGPEIDSVFDFRKRDHGPGKEFNAVMMIPTGIGCELGGHAGDGGPAAQLIASVCDQLVLHPNVVNASDINEMPKNCQYVEGSVLTRLLMGTVGLRPVRANRILLVVDDHPCARFTHASINAANGSRASGGINIAKVITLPSIEMTAGYSPAGLACGEIGNLDGVVDAIRDNLDEIDAVAIASMVDLPQDLFDQYFHSHGEMVNPWGGVEAMLTHTLSGLFNLPSAHSPMWENEELFAVDPGITDPRISAEVISVAFLHCILKGLHRSPQLLTDPTHMNHPGMISAEGISALVMPDGCLGLPTLAALEQGIPVITVDNPNIMKNDLSRLPWAPGQLIRARSYPEAAGMLAALKAGVPIDTVTRPIELVPLERR
jgi:hypothetical protein